jgi:long-chain acyl-CoA synthetase
VTNGKKISSLDLVRKNHGNCNLGDLWRPLSSTCAKKICVIDASGADDVVLTYEMLDDLVSRAVAAFRAMQIGRGARIALALPNSGTFLVAFLALMRRGAIPVLLNHRMGADSIRFMLVDSGSVGVIVDIDSAPQLKAIAEELTLPARIAVRGRSAGWRSWDDLSKAAPDTSIERMEFDDQAFQPYTAGSTGMPKGIVLTHGGMLWGVEHSQSHWPIDASARGIVAAPMFHKNAIRGTVKPMLRGGGSFVILPHFEPRRYLDAIARYEITTCSGVPAMFSGLLQERELLASGEYGRLRTIVVGSSIVSRELLVRLQYAFPAAQIRESYGLTEGGPSLAPPADRPTPMGSVGTPVPEVEVKLISETGEKGSADGELWLRSPYVLKEYAGRPELTAQRLTDGWLHTGDRFHRDADGFYYFVGRTDDMFVCGGENLYPKEVETLILKHPAVGDVVVVPLAHATKGFAPAAMVVLRVGHAVTPVELQDFCAANGPAFAIPRAVLIVPDLPISSAGKPDRPAVLEKLTCAFGVLTSRTIGRAGK